MGQEHFVNDSEVAAESAVNGTDGKASVPMDCTENEFASGPKVNSESMKVSRPWEIGGDNNGPSFYRQDIVRLNKDETLVGIVTEVGGDSDSDVIDDDDDDDDDDDESEDDEEEDEENETAHDDNEDENGDMRKSHDEKYDLTSDQVRVMWLDHSEKTHNCDEVTVIDRAFLHGDIVVAASDRTGQMGIVLNVNIWVDLLAADGSLIKDVSSRELKRVREFVVGDYVVLGSWLGRVDEVLDHVTVMFDDGSMCKVTKADPMRLKPVSKSVLEDEHFPFYPGQRVKASSSSVFKNARWLSGLWKASRLEGTVTKVNVASVIIYWIASASSGSGSATAPAEEQTPKNLKLLSCLAYANWQVGDWCFLPPVAESSALSSDKKSSRLKSEGGSICSELECEHGLEEIRLDKLDDGCSSVPNTDAMDLYIVPNQDVHACESSLPVIREPLHENGILHRKKMRKVVVRRDKKGRKKGDNFERAILISNTKTRVDVIWQDGKREYGLFSTSLVPIEDPGDQELVPEQYVVEKASDDNDNTGEVRRVGVVRSVNAKERTACVRWLKPVDRPEDPREFDKEEMVSLYGLEEHPDYDYCYGDVVIRLSPVSDSGNLVEETEQDFPTEDKLDPESNSCNETAEDTNETVEDTNETAEDTSNDETYADFSDLSWVGNIIGLKDGGIEVTWADGMVSTVGPQAIYVVGRDDGESIEVGSEIGDDDARSWQTLNEDDMDTLDTVEEEAGVQNANSIGSEAETTVNSDDNSSGRSGPLSILGFMTRLASGIFLRGRKQSDPSKESQSSGTVDASDRSASEVESSSQDSDAIDNSGRSGPLSILGFMTRLASGIFSRGRKQSGPSKESQSSGTVDASDRSASEVESSSQDSDAIDNFAEEDGHASEAADASMAVETLYSLRSDEPDVGNMMHPCSFRHFDTAKDPLDHFFLGANGQTNSGKRWLKKVQEDWDILQNNLPDSIYVRVYEDRMDLLRAVIVGAYGTPYQDGLFFFDFHLPSDYPLVPPSAHYHSGGWRINPNLYEEGKVCLSLLNTWTGRGNEVWDPPSSSILQVLVSLQGLVLNSKPYFNEAGYDKQVGTAEGEKNSLDYNENTFLLSCKYMMYLLRKPPKDFEELIKDHFQRRGHYILTACDAYMNGFAIGSLREDASLSDTSKESSPSVGFKLMLAKIVPKLFAALDEVGADVHQFKHLQQL